MYNTSENVGAVRRTTRNNWFGREIDTNDLRQEQHHASIGNKRSLEQYSGISMYDDMPFMNQAVDTRANKYMKEDIVYYNGPEYLIRSGMYGASECRPETDEAVYYGWIESAIRNHNFSGELALTSTGKKRSRGIEFDSYIGINENRSKNVELNQSTSTTTSTGSYKREFEVDQKVLLRREKQIYFGKNTIGYGQYIAQVPKELRTDQHPKTPPKHKKYSRRAWDGMVKAWRCFLHTWDPLEAGGVNGVSATSMTSDISKVEEEESADYEWIKNAIDSVLKFPSEENKTSEESESLICSDDVMASKIELNHSTSTTTSVGSKRGYETDPRTLSRRQKQIDYGRNTIGYERYLEQIPRELRNELHPRTPPMLRKYSRRGWDGLIKVWRTQLHVWDPPSDKNNNDPLADSSVPINTKIKRDVRPKKLVTED